MTLAYDADRDQDWLIYLRKQGLTGARPFTPEYEAAMERWIKLVTERVKVEPRTHGRSPIQEAQRGRSNRKRRGVHATSQNSGHR